MAAFARFTLQLVYAIASQFSKVRAFVFIDGIDEVTRFFEGVEDITEAVHRVNTEADVVWVDGHSDYGHAFEVFWERWGKRGRARRRPCIILGDARNNYHASQAWVAEGDAPAGPPRRTGSTPSPAVVLGHRRLDRRRVRHPLRRRLRVPQPAPARALRREPRVAPPGSPPARVPGRRGAKAETHPKRGGSGSVLGVAGAALVGGRLEAVGLPLLAGVYAVRCRRC